VGRQHVASVTEEGGILKGHQLRKHLADFAFTSAAAVPRSQDESRVNLAGFSARDVLAERHCDLLTVWRISCLRDPRKRSLRGHAVPSARSGAFRSARRLITRRGARRESKSQSSEQRSGRGVGARPEGIARSNGYEDARVTERRTSPAWSSCARRGKLPPRELNSA